MNDEEFKRLISDTKILNSEDLRIQRWRDCIERIMKAYGWNRDKANDFVVRRLEKDRKKKISSDRSLEQLVKDVEADELGQLI